jgi:integrase
MNINFHPRNLTQKTPQRIWAIFYAEKNRIAIDTKLFVLPNDWSRKKKCYLSTNSNYEKLNKILKEQKKQIEIYAEELLSHLMKNKKRFYKDEFEKELQDKFDYYFKFGENKPEEKGEVYDFISFIDKYISNRMELCEGTHQTLRGARKNIVLAFNLAPAKLVKKWKAMNNFERKLNPDFLEPEKQLDFSEINKSWMMAYNTWLINATYRDKNKETGVMENMPYSKNYIAKEIKIAKQFANAAADEGYISNLSYRSVKAQWEEADTIALSWQEIAKLKALELDPNTTEGKVRNLFVFNCYCGLRWSDLVRLDSSRFSREGNQLFLSIRMKKTDTSIGFPILPAAEEIMRIYNYRLPNVCVQIFCEKIKKICLKAGITELETKRETRGGKKLIFSIPRYKMVSSHTGRRTFATNFEAMGVALNELMAITGHTTEKAFRKYVKKRVETKFASFLAAGATV